MKVILHIGPHKTGTTAIQTFMNLNREALCRCGVAYPSWTEGEYNHHGLVHGLRTPGLFDATVARLHDAIRHAASAGCRCCVFSSEMFVEHEVPIGAVKEALCEHDVHVLAYIRRPDHLYASAYAQLVREDLVRRQEPIHEGEAGYDVSYATVFPKWMSHFPPGGLVIAPFDRLQWPDGNLLLDFARMIGIESVAGLTLADPRLLGNRSLPAAIVEVVRESNAVLELSTDVRERWLARLDSLAERAPSLFPAKHAELPPALIRRCLEMLAKHLETYRPYFREGFDDGFLR